jgi:hypothetical protein
MCPSQCWSEYTAFNSTCGTVLPSANGVYQTRCSQWLVQPHATNHWVGYEPTTLRIETSSLTNRCCSEGPSPSALYSHYLQRIPPICIASHWVSPILSTYPMPWNSGATWLYYYYPTSSWTYLFIRTSSQCFNLPFSVATQTKTSRTKHLLNSSWSRSHSLSYSRFSW